VSSSRYRASSAVDSLWVKKPGATREEVEDLAEAIQKATGIPVSVEGRYRWIAFAPAKTRPGPALSRYFGLFEDDELKVRGLMARRSDAPRFIKALQEAMICLLAHSDDPREAGDSLVRLVRQEEANLRRREVDVENLAVKVRLSRDPEEYISSAAQAVAAKLLRREGFEIHAGQVVRFVYVKPAKAAERRVMPVELNPSSYDVERYAQLLWRAYEEVATPLGLKVPSTRLDRFL